jgi:rubrerythrin
MGVRPIVNPYRRAMISRDDIQSLIDRPENGRRVLSAFLDMSVNSDNKRTYRIFLNKQKASFDELDSDRESHHREAVGEAFSKLERWVEANFEEANKGVAVYVEVGGDWVEGHQLPLPVENRLAFDSRPVIGPLVEITERYHHHGVVAVDREHLRLFSLYLDQTMNEREVETEPYPAPHDVKRGGFSAKDYQARKAEETRHFFKEFADEVQDFVKRYRPDDLILLGTQENVTLFREFLPDAIQKLIAHTDRAEIDASAAEIRERLAPVFEARLAEEEARAIELLRDRVRESHKAVSGFPDTLEQLQEGKVQTLIVARGRQEKGGRCEKCGFLLARASGDCPYCGGAVHNDVELVEEMVRIGRDQDARIEFVPGSAVDELGGVGGLLRF